VSITPNEQRVNRREEEMEKKGEGREEREGRES
jgi:hypothetical protein